MENCFCKVTFLLYNGVKVAKYEISYNENDTCNIDLNLYHPFNRHRTILENIKVNDVDHVVLDYMTMQAYCDTDYQIVQDVYNKYYEKYGDKHTICTQ